MAKWLSIDYGEKRTGIAVTDNLQLIASGLTTVETKQLKIFLDGYLKTEEVERIIIGQATRMSGELSAIEKQILIFIAYLQKKYPLILIERENERLTSQIAMQSMIEGGVRKKKRQNKGLVDKIAATLILQRYMERIK